MSTTYGPIIFPGPGQILTVDISQETAAMIVENQSLLDVLFSVAPASPQVVTQANVVAGIAAGLPITNGGWDLHVGPRQAAVLQIPDSSKTDTAHGRYWTGVVWIQQVNITNAQVTAGSFISQPGANVWVTAYGPGERIPDSGLTSVGYFLASQERMVSVPIVPGAFVDGSFLLGATGVNTTIGSVSIGNLPYANNAITAGLSSPGQMLALLYSCNLTMWPLSGVAGTAESQHVSLRFNVIDNASASVGTSPAIVDEFFSHLALQSDARSTWTPTWPLSTFMFIAVGAGPPYTLQLQMLVDTVSGGGGTNIKRMSVNALYDATPSTPAGPGGGIFGLSAGATYNGFVF